LEMCYNIRLASLESSFLASASLKISVSAGSFGSWLVLGLSRFAFERSRGRRRLIFSKGWDEIELMFDLRLWVALRSLIEWSNEVLIMGISFWASSSFWDSNICAF
jgi:hypothetical protein